MDEKSGNECPEPASLEIVIAEDQVLFNKARTVR
jgi:hypothetical protein